jgi:spore maturation protein CgeB
MKKYILKVGLVSDSLTAQSVNFDSNIVNITPWSRLYDLKIHRPDVLFVESAWQGHKSKWKFGIASYEDYPNRNNLKLRDLVKRALDLKIPTVFWNKEDGAHFERFIDSASLFDVVLTVDENCIPRYRERLGDNVKLGVLPFAVQPKLHYPSREPPTIRSANFVGSYSHHIHHDRRNWQDMMFRSAAPIGLTVFDRNSDRKADHYRFPDLPWLDVKQKVSYEKTADIYRKYMLSFNVNTIQDSPTAFSRRLVEIIACGGLAVTNPSLSVNRYFKDFVEVVHDEKECAELVKRIAREGLTKRDREKALAGADYVLREHTWEKRLQQIREIVGL